MSFFSLSLFFSFAMAGVPSCFRANPHGTGRAGTGHRFVRHGQGKSRDQGE
ncbi:hypothetical protein ASZ90_016295 [hydrocarbon metagenome]|uniref:Uncharacterized protein n=1 Tax=hydrocarbon metagenome TaxID=938273 RepID=A0A0W8F0X2_9ZZZZ